eukprot:Mrub_01306.p1 GENE.Mrub_01306~~Mrub_01306.p1  ORF type:complete len:659 (-),score=168.39 Mrub_01306:75-2051(-)
MSLYAYALHLLLEVKYNLNNCKFDSTRTMFKLQLLLYCIDLWDLVYQMTYRYDIACKIGLNIRFAIDLFKFEAYYSFTMMKTICIAQNLGSLVWYNMCYKYLQNPSVTYIYVCIMMIILYACTIMKYWFAGYDQSKQVAELEYRTKLSYQVIHDLRNKVSAAIFLTGNQLENTQLSSSQDNHLNNIDKNKIQKNNIDKDMYSVLEANIFTLENVSYMYYSELLFNRTYILREEIYSTQELFEYVNDRITTQLTDKLQTANGVLNGGCCDYFEVDRNLLAMAVTLVTAQQLACRASQFSLSWDSLVQGKYKTLILTISNNQKDYALDYVRPEDDLLMRQIVDFCESNDSKCRLTVKSTQNNILLLFEQAIDLEYAIGRVNETVKVLLTSSTYKHMIDKSNKIFEEDKRSSLSDKSYNSNTKHETNTIGSNSQNNNQYTSDIVSHTTVQSYKGNKLLLKSETMNDAELEVFIEDNQSVNSKSNTIAKYNDQSNLNEINVNIDDKKETQTLNSSDSNESLTKPIDYKQTCFINVDDEPSIIRINSRLFEKLGHEINACRCGSELYDLIRKMHVDKWFHGKRVCVVMDYKLDNEYGDQVIAEAKRLHRALDNCQFEMCFVGLSSTEDTAVKQKFEDQGVHKLYPKPSKKAYITEIISLALKK